MSARRYTARQEAAAAALGVRLGRVPYAEAGRAQRAACRRANADPALRLSDRRLLDAIFAFTTSYSRLADIVSVDQLVEASGLTDRSVRRCLTRLRVGGVIAHESGCGRGNLTLVGIPAAEKGATPSAAFSDEESGQTNVHLLLNEKRPRDEPKGGQARQSKVDERARAVLTEKETEKRYAEKPSSAKVKLPDDLARLLGGRFDLTQRQLREVLAAYGENRDGLARLVLRAIGGSNPSALLTVLVREQAHREDGEDTVEEVIELLDLIDGYAPDSTDQSEPPLIDGLTPDEWADYLYMKHADIFKRPVERRRP